MSIQGTYEITWQDKVGDWPYIRARDVTFQEACQTGLDEVERRAGAWTLIRVELIERTD